MGTLPRSGPIFSRRSSVVRTPSRCDGGISGGLLEWIGDYLQGRQQRVCINGQTSQWADVLAGVPQGSVLSPTLFSIFINDIFVGVPEQVRSSLYADDGALWVTASELPAALALMQTALDSVASWTHTWGLTIAKAKTHAIVFTSRRGPVPTPLQFCGTDLQFVPSVRFLGVLFDQRLTWRSHILNLRDRCRKDLQLLSVVASHRWGASYTTLCQLYTALVLPKLDYGSFLYASAAPSVCILLDRIQYASIRIILGALRCTPVFRLEAEADLLPLGIRCRQLLSQYGSRVLSIPNHPVCHILCNYFPMQDHITTPCVLPALGRLHDEFRFLSIQPEDIAQLPMELRYHSGPLPVLSTLCTNKWIFSQIWCGLSMPGLHLCFRMVQSVMMLVVLLYGVLGSLCYLGFLLVFLCLLQSCMEFTLLFLMWLVSQVVLFFSQILLVLSVLFRFCHFLPITFSIVLLPCCFPSLKARTMLSGSSVMWAFRAMSVLTP